MPQRKQAVAQLIRQFMSLFYSSKGRGLIDWNTGFKFMDESLRRARGSLGNAIRYEVRFANGQRYGDIAHLPIHRLLA